MRMLYALVLAVILCPAAMADDWRLVFTDEFERDKVGEMYELGERGKGLTIKDGALRLVGSGATVMLQKSLKPDVRLEFDAWAGNDMPPCDLSCKLSTQYLLGFGARSNSANHLVGPGIRDVDLDPPFIIEEGRKYHFIATREGMRITYQVDDTVVLDATGENLMGGDGFDQIGFVTWGEMLVDNLKVYERVVAHPDTPKYLKRLPPLPIERDGARINAARDVSAMAKKAIDAFNRRDLAEAKKLFEQVTDAEERLAGLACVLGDVDYIERPVCGDLGSHKDFGELGELAELWVNESRRNPTNDTLRACIPAVRHFGKLVLSRNGRNDATVLINLGPQHNPFYHKALLFQARYIYWDGMEGANAEVKGRALEIMRELYEIWPNNRVLREYVGEPVPWGEELNADTAKDPEWAAYLREAYAREIAVMERLVDERQAPNGAFGGGLGDDVEMMRKWVPIAAISSCSEKILTSIEKLSDCVRQDAAPRGYNEGLGDVEHSAEPTADSWPTMLVLRHGDPKWVEWNLDSCRILKDVTMGIDDKGFPRFKATDICARFANEQLVSGGDTGYHARAMKHFFYLAWYGNEEAKDWYVRWVDGWRNTVMIDEPTKIAGMAPGTIWYPGGDYNSPNGHPWYSEKAHNYYGPQGMGGMVQQTFLAAYSLTGDRRFLHPFQRMMDRATFGPYEGGPHQPGSREWQITGMAHQAGAGMTSHYRMLTGERVYDEYTKRFGVGQQMYQIDKDLDRYKASFEKAARSLRHNLWYYTTEVLSTDRLHLPAVPEVFGAYTGAISTFVDAETPTMGVTWTTPDANFAVIVTENSPTRLRAQIYTFWDEPKDVTMHLWQLKPGTYIAVQGEELPGEQPFQKRYGWGEPEYIKHVHRGDTYTLTIPQRTTWVVDLRLHEEIDVPELAADLAIHERDVKVADGKIGVTIHNIGALAADDFAVAMQHRKGDDWVTIAEQRIHHLSQPVGFRAFTHELAFTAPPDNLKGTFRIMLDPAEHVFEITERNNVAEWNE